MEETTRMIPYRLLLTGAILIGTLSISGIVQTVRKPVSVVLLRNGTLTIIPLTMSMNTIGPDVLSGKPMSTPEMKAATMSGFTLMTLRDT